VELEDAVRTIAAGHVTTIDVGEVNSRLFVNNSSIGVYPDMVIEREALRQKGYRKWTAAALATMNVLSRYPGVVVRVRVEEAEKVFRTPFLFVGNNEYEIDGLRVGARSRLDAGCLAAYLAPRLHVRDLPLLALLAVLGRASDNPALEAFTGTSFVVETPGGRRLRVALDGEVTQMTSPLRFALRPRALHVLVPAQSR
jgi:diacylglycerol kinase family enzyme